MIEGEKAKAEGAHKVMEDAGFGVFDTGGGNMAWSSEAKAPKTDNSYVLISNDGSTDGDPDGKIWTVGRYGIEGGFVEMYNEYALQEAIEISKLLPSPHFKDQYGADVFQEGGYDSLEQAIEENNQLLAGEGPKPR